MLSFLSNTRVDLAAGQTDLRKSFDPLAEVVRWSLQVDPLSGHLFVFSKQRRHRVKILFWDKSGGWLCAQRLESGTLGWPSSADEVLKLLRMVSATQPRSGGGRSERDCAESQSHNIESEEE